MGPSAIEKKHRKLDCLAIKRGLIEALATTFVIAQSTAICLAQEKSDRPFFPNQIGPRTVLEFGVDYDHIIRENPNDYIAWYRRGQLKERKLNITGALSDYAQSIKLNPLQSDHPGAHTRAEEITLRAWAYEYSGLILLKRQKYKEGIESLTHAINMRPNFYPNYQNRGLAYKQLGQLDPANKDFAKVSYLKKAHLPDPCARAPIKLASSQPQAHTEKAPGNTGTAD